MVKVDKSRFQEMYEIKDYSERKLGIELEKRKKKKEEGSITYRSLQRCLSVGSMKYETVELCAYILDCHPRDLMGFCDIRLEELPEADRKKCKHFKDGTVIRSYSDYENIDQKRLQAEAISKKHEDNFKAWLNTIRKEIDKTSRKNGGLSLSDYERRHDEDYDFIRIDCMNLIIKKLIEARRKEDDLEANSTYISLGDLKKGR